jgi:hypothetical protein
MSFVKRDVISVVCSPHHRLRETEEKLEEMESKNRRLESDNSDLKRKLEQKEVDEGLVYAITAIIQMEGNSPKLVIGSKYSKSVIVAYFSPRKLSKQA